MTELGYAALVKDRLLRFWIASSVGAPWLPFAGLALVLVGLHLGVLWRAVAREEEAVERTARAHLGESARVLEARLGRELEEAERMLERDVHRTPTFAIPLQRNDDGRFELAGRVIERPTQQSPECERLGFELGTTSKGARRGIIERLLGECPLARGPSGALLVPLLHKSNELDDTAWLAWQRAHHDEPDAVALRRLDGILAALSQKVVHEREARTVRVDVAEGRARVRREGDAVVGFLVTPSSLVKAIGAYRVDGLAVQARERATSTSSATMHEPVHFGSFDIGIELADPKELAARSTRSRGLVLALSLASLSLTLGTAIVLLRRMSRLRRENELRVDFVAAVSHELRTPLASIRLLSEVLRREDLPAAERNQAFASLDESVTHLADQTERWLTLARLGKEQLVAHRREADLAEAVQHGIERFVELRSTEVLVVAEPCVFSFDPFLVSLIVENLLENAYKYARNGSPYRLSLARTDKGVSLTCIDHGPGFPPNAARLLLPFERGDTRLHAATEGVGLGLSLVRAAARAHRGSVKLGNEPDGGARVVVTLEKSLA